MLARACAEKALASSGCVKPPYHHQAPVALHVQLVLVKNSPIGHFFYTHTIRYLNSFFW